MRARLAFRLSERRKEIEGAVRQRVVTLASSEAKDNREYERGLHLAISDALNYALDSVETGEEGAPPLPVTLLTQARLAARSGVDLDTVLRRYVAGNAIFTDFMIETAESDQIIEGTVLQRLVRSQSVLFDRLLIAISEEHKRETSDRLITPERRLRYLVERMLAGELLDDSTLGYELNRFHTAVIVAAPNAAEVVRRAARMLDRQALIIPQEGQVIWSWLGGRAPTSPDAVLSAFGPLSDFASVATGEPGVDRAGWQRTHLQAMAALPFATRQPGQLVRYTDIGVVAAVARDDLVTSSLDELFVSPLEANGDDTLLNTLRAYFAADRNVSSAAAWLKVSRPTITKRLRIIEDLLGRPLSVASMELEIALRLRDLNR